VSVWNEFFLSAKEIYSQEDWLIFTSFNKADRKKVFECNVNGRAVEARSEGWDVLSMVP
jgi:hypothetical protein